MKQTWSPSSNTDLLIHPVTGRWRTHLTVYNDIITCVGITWNCLFLMWNISVFMVILFWHNTKLTKEVAAAHSTKKHTHTHTPHRKALQLFIRAIKVMSCHCFPSNNICTGRHTSVRGGPREDRQEAAPWRIPLKLRNVSDTTFKTTVQSISVRSDMFRWWVFKESACEQRCCDFALVLECIASLIDTNFSYSAETTVTHQERRGAGNKRKRRLRKEEKRQKRNYTVVRESTLKRPESCKKRQFHLSFRLFHKWFRVLMNNKVRFISQWTTLMVTWTYQWGWCNISNSGDREIWVEESKKKRWRRENDHIFGVWTFQLGSGWSGRKVLSLHPPPPLPWGKSRGNPPTDLSHSSHSCVCVFRGLN